MNVGDGNGKKLKIFKIILVGDSFVGKTCLASRFCEGKYAEDFKATVGVDFKERVVTVRGEEVKLQLWDTAGQERFRNALTDHFYRNADAIVIVYDITRMHTFETIPYWLDECARQLPEEVPRILVGNKNDCKDSEAVPTDQALRLAHKWNIPLYETSAQSTTESSNIEAIFLTLAVKVMRERSSVTATRSSSLGNNQNLPPPPKPEKKKSNKCFCS